MKNSPSFHRNIGPISEKLERILPRGQLKILEIGSGSGQHATALAHLFGEAIFYPSDPEPENVASIDAWALSEGAGNVRPARILDVTNPPPELRTEGPFDVILCFNVIHISPWQVTKALFSFARDVTEARARVILYGPYKIDREHTSESNIAFEGWLKSQDERFGVRDMADVEGEAQGCGFSLHAKHEMPANNFLLEFEKNRAH